MKFPRACVAVFAKEPVAGKVKTRLIPALGAEGALTVHLDLMDRIFTVLNNLVLCPTQLWVSANPSHSAFAKFTGEHKLQAGADLGQKMNNTANNVLIDYESVVIIGSDCPQMDEDYLLLALKALQDHDLVFGPAMDGGYVLIGMNQACPAVFEGVEWGTERVLQQSRERLTRHNLSWHELPPLFDIDRPEDLEML